MRQLFFIALFAISYNLIGQVEATFDHKRFNAPNIGPYIETYLSVKAPSVKYVKNKNGRLQATISVSQIITFADSIVTFDKSDLKSPIVGNDSIAEDFILQRRFTLAPGTYNLELIIKDVNTTDDFIHVNQPLIIKYLPEDPTFSDIEFLSKFQKATEVTEFTKGGYTVVPHVSNYFPQSLGKIAYYAEIYGLAKSLDSDERVSSYQYIEKKFSGTKMTGYHKFGKITVAPVNAIFNTIDIEDLATGEYNLVFQIRGKSNKLLAEKKIMFTRSNPQGALVEMNSLEEINYTGSFAEGFATEDSINEALRCLVPIATDLERNLIDNKLEALDLEMKQKYFYNFWHSRYGMKDKDKWETYHVQVEKTNELFGTTIKKGYQTDRGRIYLKYGAPNSMTDRANNPNYYPYQIWHYYKLEKFSNKKFLFYNRDLVNNEYDLLHSNLLGERQNTKWELVLGKRTNAFESIDATAPMLDTYGETPKELWLNPR